MYSQNQLFVLQNYTKEFPKNFRLALPVIIGQLGQIVVGFADNIMVGKLGAESLAAVSLGNAVFAIALSLSIGFSLSITPLIAESDGKKDVVSGNKIFKDGVWFCVIIGFLLYGLIKLLQPYLPYFNQPTEVITLATPYLNITALSIIPFTVFMAFKQFTDGMSATKYAMIATVSGNILNVFLNYVLIYGELGFPKLEIEGAAISSLISRVTMLLLLIFLIRKQQKYQAYFKDFFKEIFSTKAIQRILNLGIPVALQMLFEFGFFSSSIFLSGNLSTANQAANQIALNLASMAFMIAIGFGVTATIRVGNHMGKRNYPELIRIVRSILLLVLLLEIVLAVFFVTTHQLLPTFYVNEIEVIDIAAQLLIIVAWFQLSDGLQVTLLGVLRGLQDAYVPTLLIFISYWCIGFPICYHLGQANQLGTYGIWIGLLTGLFSASILLFLRYRYLISKKGGVIRNLQ